MIQGLGTDIISIDRIRKSAQRLGEAFLLKVFTQSEIDYCLRHADPYPSFAARFAAKEAAVKALGTGFRNGLSWKDIEVVKNEEGKPSLSFHGASPPLGQFFLSMSHCKSYATATVVWVNDPS